MTFTTGAAFPSPVVHAPRSVNAGYKYRNQMGMIPCAEYDVFFDDFHQFVTAAAITNGPGAYVPFGWSGSVLDSGTTVTTLTTAAVGAHGVLSITDATASEGAAVYGAKSIQLTAGKRFFIETRFYTDDVTDNTMFFGLSDLTATTNPEDLWTTTAASLAVYGFLDPMTATTYLADASNAGTAAVAGTLVPTAATWQTYAIEYDGAALNFYLDGKLDSSTTTTIPTGIALAPFFGARNGNGAGGNVQYFDYIRWVCER